jgi:hypothetical protein
MGSSRTVIGGNITAQEADLVPQTGLNETLLMASEINSKMVATGKTYPKTCHLTRAVYWYYKQWREAGAIEQLMSVLHGQVREQVKKKPSGRR